MSLHGMVVRCCRPDVTYPIYASKDRVTDNSRCDVFVKFGCRVSSACMMCALTPNNPTRPYNNTPPPPQIKSCNNNTTASAARFSRYFAQFPLEPCAGSRPLVVTKGSPPRLRRRRVPLSWSYLPGHVSNERPRSSVSRKSRDDATHRLRRWAWGGIRSVGLRNC